MIRSRRPFCGALGRFLYLTQKQTSYSGQKNDDNPRCGKHSGGFSWQRAGGYSCETSSHAQKASYTRRATSALPSLSVQPTRKRPTAMERPNAVDYSELGECPRTISSCICAGASRTGFGSKRLRALLNGGILKPSSFIRSFGVAPYYERWLCARSWCP